jgi:hypothetical protein
VVLQEIAEHLGQVVHQEQTVRVEVQVLRVLVEVVVFQVHREVQDQVDQQEQVEVQVLLEIAEHQEVQVQVLQDLQVLVK